MKGGCMKYLKWFYIATVAIMCFGAIINIADQSFDIYQAWAVIANIAGVVLIEEKK